MSQRAVGAALAPPPRRVNVARLFLARAAERPGALAIAAAEGTRAAGARWRTVTFAELEHRVRSIAAGLARRGVRPGDRACVLVRPGVELVAITYALLLAGAVPVLVDPGMGARRVLACLARTRPSVAFAIPRAWIARWLRPRALASVRLWITVGGSVGLGGPTLARLAREGERHGAEPADTAASDPAAILFTSGSTGPAKGVLYAHETFAAQVETLRAMYALEPGEVDLACFPLFALFDGALGLTSVFPPIDASRPARCDPSAILAAIERHRPTLSFGSPAIWKRVAPHARASGVRLDPLRRVLVAGAPVPAALIEELRALLPPGADVHTPYGATEALPVTTLAGAELFPARAERVLAGAGTCVGRAAPGVEIRIARVHDGPIERWSDDLECPLGRPGEICVRGPVVTAGYADDESATRRARIAASDGGRDWHRMGDAGRIDDEGYLWFLGRIAHRLETAKGLRFPVPAENVFDRHPRVERSALVGVGERGHQAPLLVVQPKPGAMPRSEAEIERFLVELREIGRGAHASSDVEMFLFRASFPVDVRHNAKIDREALARWAERELA